MVTRETTLTVDGRKLPSRRTTVLTPLVGGQASFAPEDSRWPRDISNVTAPSDPPPATEDGVFGEEPTFEFFDAPDLLAIPADIGSFVQAGNTASHPDCRAIAALVTPNAIESMMLDQLSHIKADVAWYPSTTHVFDMVADANGHASIDRNGVRADCIAVIHPTPTSCATAGRSMI